MSWKLRITLLLGALAILLFVWDSVSRKWRFRLVLLVGLASVLVFGKPALNRVRHLGALDIHKEEPLPLTFNHDGIAGQRIGPLRIYLAVPPEVQLEQRARAATVPILIVLENDTYQPLSSDNLDWRGPNLFSVRVVRLGEGQNEEVYRTEVPVPNGGFRLLSTERRSITINWPLENVAAGDYKVSIEFPVGKRPAMETGTRLL